MVEPYDSSVMRSFKLLVHPKQVEENCLAVQEIVKLRFPEEKIDEQEIVQNFLKSNMKRRFAVKENKYIPELWKVYRLMSLQIIGVNPKP